MRKSVPGFGGIVLKRCLKFSCLGKRQADKVFISVVFCSYGSALSGGSRLVDMLEPGH